MSSPSFPSTHATVRDLAGSCLNALESEGRGGGSSKAQSLLEQLFQRFPGTAAVVVACLDEGGKKRLRACSRACRAAVNPALKSVTVPPDGMARIYIPLLQSACWRHLQELHLR
jgi:hypothetical protein